MSNTLSAPPTKAGQPAPHNPYGSGVSWLVTNSHKPHRDASGTWAQGYHDITCVYESDADFTGLILTS